MALTGYLVNQGHSTICAPDSAAAIVALGGMFPTIAGSDAYICDAHTIIYSAPTTFDMLIECHSMISSKEYAFAHSIHLARCDPSDTLGTHASMFADGLSMGWGVVAAMAAAMAVIFLKQALFTR
jgi:hypothetical protein